MMGLQSEVDEFRMFCIVIVLLCLNARIGNVIDLHRHAKFVCGRFHYPGQVENGELFGELVVNPALAFGGRVMTGNLDTSHGVPNVEEAACLPALAVDSERLADGCLHAETVQDGAEHVVVVESIDQRLIQRGFVRHRSVNHALIEVCGSNAPNLAGKHNVVAVVHFREVIKGPGLLREGNHILAAVMFDGDVAFFDVDVGRAIFAHGPQLDEMTIRRKLTDGKQDVQSPYNVIDLGENSMLAVNHRIGSGALLREMNYRIRFEGFERRSQKIVIGNVADEQLDGLTRNVLPDPDAVRQRTNRSQRLRAKFMVPEPPQKVIKDGDRMAPLRQIESCGPTAIAVPTEHSNLHVPSSGQACSRVSFYGNPNPDPRSLDAQPGKQGYAKKLLWTGLPFFTCTPRALQAGF